MKRWVHQSGFSTIEVLLVVLVMAVLTVTGLVVYHHHNRPSSAKSSTVTSTNQTTAQPHNTTTAQPVPDPYAGWQTYMNNSYGISYKYPTTWTTSEEIKVDTTTRNTDANHVEFATGLKLTSNVNYNNTVEVEVLGEPLSTAVSWYDGYYAQSQLNKVTKESEILKGKQAVGYDVINSGRDSKLYLFSVGNKTYMFGSINEELNVQRDPNYWSTFQKVFDSLTLQ